MNCLYYIFVFLAIHGCGCYFIMVAFATWVTLKPAKCCAAIFFHCLHLSLISYLLSPEMLSEHTYTCVISPNKAQSVGDFGWLSLRPFGVCRILLRTFRGAVIASAVF